MELKRVEARIPIQLYKNIKIEGVEKDKSLNDIINESLVNREIYKTLNKIKRCEK